MLVTPLLLLPLILTSTIFRSSAYLFRSSLWRQGSPSLSSLMLMATSAASTSRDQSTSTTSTFIHDDDPYDLYQRMRNTSATDIKMGAALHSALDVLEQAVRLYGPSNVYCSFNGGKDAVVILHLLRAVVGKYCHDSKEDHHKPMLIYFPIADEFPEVLKFIGETEDRFRIPIFRSNSSIAKGLGEVIQSKKSEQHLAFVLGTRKGDPNCGEQSSFTPSSPWMPPFMRVNPIISWTYGQVWLFLRQFELPYCSLYDKGFTSLGKRSDTRPNPALAKTSSSSSSSSIIDSTVSHEADDDFYPAYMLQDWSLERAGRGDKIKDAGGQN